MPEPISPYDFDKILSSISGNGIECKQPVVKLANLKAMVVEDNFINQDLVKAMFEKLSIDVRIFDNGQVAIEEYKKNFNYYDIIFMDLRMPIMDGIEATKKIREFEKRNNLSPIPIVALTANISLEEKDRFIEAGANEYLSKPTNQSILVKTINDLI